MRKIGLVFKREYLARVRTKGFIFSTFVVPLMLVAVIGVTAFVATHQSVRTQQLGIIDGTASLSAAIARGFEPRLRGGQPAYRVARQANAASSGEENRLREEFRAQVIRGELDGFLLIPSGYFSGENSVFYARNTGDVALSTTVRQALNDAGAAYRLKAIGLDYENIRPLLKGVPMTLIKVKAEGEEEERGQTLGLAIVLMTVLYMTIFVYGIATMQSVQEEKNSRVVELLVSSLRPSHLLWGKLMGVGAVGFTQLSVWLATAAAVGIYGRAAAELFWPGNRLPRIELPFLVIFFIVTFFIAGYFLYASLYAAIGAMVSSTEESQQIATPVNLLLGFSPVMMGFILRSPNSPTAVTLSMIPFFSPVHMVLRMALQTPPLWQILLSLAIILLTTSGIIWLSARIYRVGILMYGKRPSLRELARWVRYS
ncbi:MAG: ABC transporter permease [Acidobacteria bacterium]|nr:ABC transporter permease [Acidobacteriota bacterium]